jgi:branched-chain amino acid transport system permease protein
MSSNNKLTGVFLALTALILIVVPPFLKNYGVYLFSLWLVFVVATMGLNLTVGYAGQKSLGQAAFFGIGAYGVAILMKAGLSWWLGLPIAMLACFVVGLAVGFPALRVQTIYLAFATLGFNTAMWLVFRNEEWLTGGTFGFNGIARPEIFGFSLKGHLAYYYFVLAISTVAIALLWSLLRSPWGKAFQALRDNPIRAESLGIDTRAYTLLSFAIGAVYAGLAGALYASLTDYIDPASFTVGASITMYLMVVVGGAGYFLGPLVGALVGLILPEWIRDVAPVLANWYLPVFGAMVIAMLVWLPDGLMSLPEKLFSKRKVLQAGIPSAQAAMKSEVTPSVTAEANTGEAK